MKYFKPNQMITWPKISVSLKNHFILKWQKSLFFSIFYSLCFSSKLKVHVFYCFPWISVQRIPSNELTQHECAGSKILASKCRYSTYGKVWVRYVSFWLFGKMIHSALQIHYSALNLWYWFLIWCSCEYSERTLQTVSGMTASPAPSAHAAYHAGGSAWEAAYKISGAVLQTTEGQNPHVSHL